MQHLLVLHIIPLVPHGSERCASQSVHLDDDMCMRWCGMGMCVAVGWYGNVVYVGWCEGFKDVAFLSNADLAT